MKEVAIRSDIRHIDLPLYFLPPAFITIFLWVLSEYEINPLQVTVAYILLCIPWVGYCMWKRKSEDEIPLYPIIAFAYWVYYALPLFWGDHDSLGAGWRRFRLTEETATDVMLLVFLGVVSIGLGMRLRIGRKWAPKNPIDVQVNKKGWRYTRIVLAVGTIVGLDQSLAYILGEEGRQIILILQNDLPLLAFALLFRGYVRGTACRTDKILLILFLVVSFLVGVSSGWLGAFVSIMILCTLVYVSEQNKMPRLILVSAIIYVLFFQVGKTSVREKYWYNQSEGGRIERVQFWLSESFTRWEGALSGNADESVKKLAYESISRLSLLNQTANVLDLTPSEVPYQYGNLYSFLPVALVPRFVWPNKPSVSEANRFYQTAYGLTEERNLDKISIAVGVLTESYISFGWPGVLLVMFLMGILFDFIQRTFLSKTSGFLFTTIGIVLVPSLMVIESQMAQYISGLVQKIFLMLVVLSPIIRISRISKDSPDSKLKAPAIS